MGFWFGNVRKRGHLEDIGIDGKILMKWILTLSNPIFLPTAYSPAFICFGR
jgi:hypothetical protein